MSGEVWRSGFEYSSIVRGCLSTQAKKLVGSMFHRVGLGDGVLLAESKLGKGL